jgi:hypothetical protein
MNRYLVAFTVLAAFVNPVPSRAMLHPIRWRNDPVVDDIMGSGFEHRDAGRALTRAACEEPLERKVARQWRDLAARVRRLAALSGEAERARLMGLAEQYEERARRWEADHPPPSG